MPLNLVLADDHTVVRQGLAALLRAEPDIAILGEASDGESAWAAIRAHEPDIAILDLGMPKADGIQVTRRVAAAGLATRCLLVTMHDDPSLALEAQRAGAAGYVLKDCAFEDLILAVRGIAAGGTFLSPSIQTRLRALRRDGRAAVALSAREQEVVRLLAAGKTSKEIGRVMGVSPRTVDTYRQRIMEKLGLESPKELVRYAVRRGMVG